MAEDAGKQNPPSLDELSQRLDAARGAASEERTARAGFGAALGRAFRVATELLAALFVGGLLGYGADRLFGTQPWLLLLGLAFGFAAGLRNLARAVQLMNNSPSDTDARDDKAGT